MSGTTSIDNLTTALNYLVEQPNYQELKDEIAALSTTRHGVFSGLLSPLNPLVHYARGKGGPEWLLTLWRVSDEAVGCEVAPEEAPTQPPAKRDKSRHADYQRTYMRATRDRDRKACALRYQLYSDAAKRSMPNGLVGVQRRTFLDTIHALWQARKAEALEGVVYATERNELGNRFWQTVDEQLTAGLAGDLSTARYVLGLDAKEK